MKLTSLHKTLLFFIILLGSMYMNASDTLKVKKVRFFIEPKAVCFIPRQSPDVYQNVFSPSGVNLMRGGCGGPSYITKSVNWQNISPAMNASISCGMFVRLSKYFNYELSLAYYHYTLKYKATEGITNISSGDYSTMSYNWNYTSNALFISNGLSFTYKKFILTNSLMLGMNFPTHSSNYYYTYSPSLYLMSEHKIGYNIYKNRIEPYIGINVLDNFRTAAVIPFASVRINF